MRDYSILARFLQGLQKDDNARFFYDLCADALVWSDEVPPIGSPDCDTFNAPDLRGVWRYRTTLILGRPEEKRRLAREEARKHFPNWPGFDPKRCDASLASTFLAMQEAAMKKWNEDEERYNEQVMSNERRASA